MDISTGKVYPSTEDAKKAGVDEANLIKLFATEEQAQKISKTIKAGLKEEKHKTKKKQKDSRKKNRK